MRMATAIVGFEIRLMKDEERRGRIQLWPKKTYLNSYQTTTCCEDTPTPLKSYNLVSHLRRILTVAYYITSFAVDRNEWRKGVSFVPPFDRF